MFGAPSQRRASALIAERRSVYDSRNEPQLLRQAQTSGLLLDVTAGRLERVLAQKEAAEAQQAANDVRLRRMQKEAAFNIGLQLERARSELETGRLTGLQAAAMQPRILELQNRLAAAPQTPASPPQPRARASPPAPEPMDPPPRRRGRLRPVRAARSAGSTY